MSRALLSEPGLIVADEPTQGVDVGARFEIYRILREVSSSGTPVVVNSSDAAELEGLCDKVIVLSRGRAVATLTGADVSEARIVAAAVSATAHVGTGGLQEKARSATGGLRHFLQSDNAPAVPLTLVIILLGLYVFSQNANFLSAFNIYNILCWLPPWDSLRLGRPSRCCWGHRPIGWPARRFSGRRGFVLHKRRQIHARDHGWFCLGIFWRICRRRDQRNFDSLCEFHAHSRNAGHVHWPAGHEFPSS